jgi:hypothetical protein
MRNRTIPKYKFVGSDISEIEYPIIFIIPAAHKSKENGPESSLSNIIYQGFPIFLVRAFIPYYI